MEKHGSENRGDSKQNLQCVFGHKDFDARIKIKNFSIEPSSTVAELLIDTLMREYIPVATQNIKFEDSVKLVSKSVFGTLVQSGFWCKEHNRPLFIRLTCHYSNEIDWHIDGTDHTCSFGENWVRISRKIKIISTFWNFCTIRFLLKRKKRHLFNQTSAQKWINSIETWMEETEPLLTANILLKIEVIQN